MTEETKQETKQETATEIPKEAPKAPEAAKAAVKSGKGSRPRQCAQCSKNLQKKTWYYRDNKYFCNKRCWKASKVPKPAAA